jgi:hypothetical protein
MDPITIATTLSKLLAVGLAAHKAHQNEGFDDRDVTAIKEFLGASSLLPGNKADPRPAANLLAITTRAFGTALARHWAGSAAMVPATTRLPNFLAQIVSPDEHGRRQEIDLRTRQAALRLLEPGTGSDDEKELALLQQLAGEPVQLPYYQALWAAFTNAQLDENAGSPLLLTPGMAREFERHFRLAFDELMATDLGRHIQTWRLELAADAAPRTIRTILAQDLASWGTRHVFGNLRAPPRDNSLPFMSLEAIYVEPC